MAKWVGDDAWDSGPIVVAPPALLAAWGERYGSDEAKLLKNARAVAVIRFGAHEALVLGGGKETAWHPGPQALVRLGGKVVLGPKVKQAMNAMPNIEEKTWRVTNLSLHVKGGQGLVVFDAKAQQKVPKPLASRGKSKLVLPFPDGPYFIESAKTKQNGFDYSLVRLYRAGGPKPVVEATAKKKTRASITVTPEVQAAWKKLTWVGDAEGAATIVLPAANASKWKTSWEIDAKGVGDVIQIGGKDALVLGDPGMTAVHPTESGALVLKQVIAFSPAVLAAALAVPEAAWKKTKKTFDAGDGKLVVLHAGARAPSKLPRAADIGPGSYAIDEHPGFEATVGGEKVEVQLVRLRRRT